MRLEPFSPKHEDSILDSTGRINMWEGAVRAAKTMASIIRWLEYVENEAPPGRLHMIGKTERTLRMNVLDPIQELVGERRFRINQGGGFALYRGKKIWLVGANDQRAEAKIRGATSAGMYGDQAELWPESFFDMSLSRMSLPGAKGFYTLNPENPRHWLKRKYLDRSGELDLRKFHFEIDDNTALPMEFIEALKKEYGPPGSLWYRRYIKGLWVLAEGVIYDMFDEDRHVVDVLPPTKAGVVNRSFGIDYGTVNPFHAVCGEIRLDHDGIQRLYITNEWRWDSKAKSRQLTDAQYSKEMRSWIGNTPYDRIQIDPSAASFIRQLYNDGFRGVTPADNEVADGLRTVSSLLSLDLLRIHRSCIHLIEEISGYSWDPKAAERGDDKPMKVDDHGPDALRYLVRGLGRYVDRWLKWRHKELEEDPLAPTEDQRA